MTTSTARNDLSPSAPSAGTSLLEDGDTANNNNNIDNGIVFASSSHEVPRNCWDAFSEFLLILSWVGGSVYIIYASTEMERPPQIFELVLVVMLVVLNLIVGSRLLWRMYQRQRACVEEAQKRCSSTNAPDSSSDGVAVDHRPNGCCCDARSFFTAVLSLCWWSNIRGYVIVKWDLWLGWSWRMSPVSLSIGFLVGAVTVQFVTWFLNSVNRKYSCFDPKLAATAAFAAATGILSLLSIVGFILSWLRRVDAIEPLRQLLSLPFVDDNGTPYDWETTLDDWDSNWVYSGDAYVRNVTFGEDFEDETEFCKGSNYWDKVIHVDVDVYFGDSWACPASSDAQCETTVRSEVSCKWLVVDIEMIHSPEKSKENATAQDFYDAVQRHYHNYDNKNIDNDDYDPYGFEDDDAFDPDSAPQSRGSQWFAFTEPIFGNCGTCEAMSVSTISRAVDRGCRATTNAHVFLGATIAAICCLAAVFVPKKKSAVIEESSSPMTFAPIGSGNE